MEIPCRDKPEPHLEFLVPEDLKDHRLGLVRAKERSNGKLSEKGVRSEEALGLGLSRLDLIKARRDRLTSVLAHIACVINMVAEIEDRGESKRLTKWLATSLIELKRVASNESPYSTAISATISKYLDGLVA